MKKKYLKLLGVIAASALLLTACGSKKEGSNGTGTDTNGNAQTESSANAADVATPEGNRIVTNNSSEPGSLDPALAQGTHESFPLNHLFAGVTRISPEGKVENALADNIDVSDDGLTYTITLKKDLKWSDGNPITAADFEFSWKRVLDPSMGAKYAYQLYYIKGAQAYNEGNGKIEDVAVKALDDLTIEVGLENPTAYFDSVLAFYTYYPVEKALVESNPDWAKDPSTYVSSGAFKLTAWDHNARISMDKNPNFYDADNVKIDGIDFDILEDQNTAWQKFVSGEYNMVPDLPVEQVAALKEANDSQLIIGNDLGVYYYNLNPAVKPLNNVKVRKALSMAIDRSIITDNITRGGQLPATGLVPGGLKDDTGKDFTESGKALNLVTTDIEKAKQLLEEGLQEEGMSAADLNMTILYNTLESHKAIAEVIQQMWSQNLGINVSLENVEFQVKLDREKAKDYEISRAGWIGDYEDPMTFIDMFVTGGTQNDVSYSNPEYDRLVNEAKASIDQKLRMDNMKKAEQLLLEDAAIIPIYFYTRPYAIKPNVTGIYKNITQYPNVTYATIAH